MGVHAFLGCPAVGCGYAVSFHAPDVEDPPESLVKAWTALLHEEHPRHPRPLRFRPNGDTQHLTLAPE